MLGVSSNQSLMRSISNCFFMISSYTTVLGMMNEELDWYVKQIDELRMEYKTEMGTPKSRL